MILIIGGNGYLGKRFTDFLYKKGYKLIVGHSHRNFKKENISRVTSKYCNVLDKKSLIDCTKSADIVINLSGLNAQESISNSKLANDIKVLGHMNLCEASIESNVKKIISFSTIHVYKNPLIGDFCEDSQTTPNHPYGFL